jgi:O-antigen/teichoic acid export membrane protein
MTTAREPLEGAAGRAFSWNLAAISVSQAISFGVFLLLAGKLAPSAFGVFAIAAMLVDLLAAQGRQAVTDHLVQAEDPSPRRVAETFTAALAIALAAWAGLALAAGPLAKLTKEPDLALILPLLGVVMPLGAVQAVLEAGVLRRLAFRDYAARTMVGAVAGSAAAAACVFTPAATAALALQKIVGGLAVIALLARRAGPMTPALARPAAEFSMHAPAIARLWGAHIVNGLLARVCDVIVGARLGVEALGVLRVSDRVVDAAHAAVTSPLSVAWAPILAALRNDPAARTRHYLDLTSLAALLCAPAFVGLALVGGDLTALMFDERYAAAASLLPLVALAALAAPLAYFRTAVLTALGRTRAVVTLTIADLAVTAAGVWIGSGAGLIGAGVGMIAASAIGAAASLWIVARAIEARPLDALRASAPAFAAAAAMIAPAWALQAALSDESALARFAAVAIAGALTFTGVLLGAFPKWTRARLNYLRPPSSGSP